MNLIEILLALTLSSAIMITLSQTLSILSRDHLALAQETQSEDSALLALLLLQHQLSSSRESECTPSTEISYHIIDTPTEYGLAIDELEDTLYIRNPDEAQQTHLTKIWDAKTNPTLILDDCHSQQSLDLNLAEQALATAQNFPISISRKVTHRYLWQNHQLILYQGTDNLGPLFEHLAEFKLTQHPDHSLSIQILPENANAPFSIQFKPNPI